MSEVLVESVFAQAALVAYACDLGVGIYLVPSALAFVDFPEHGFALVGGKLRRHYVPLPLVPLPTVRLPDRTAIFSPRCRASGVGATGTCLLAGLTHVMPCVWLTLYVQLYTLRFSDQGAERQAYRCLDLRGPTRRR
jgi:hypothetical protein